MILVQYVRGVAEDLVPLVLFPIRGLAYLVLYSVLLVWRWFDETL